MITDGKYEDVSSTTRAEIKERRAQIFRFSAYICALFSAGILLISAVKHDSRDFSAVVAFAFFAVLQFSVSKLLQRR